MIDYVISQIDVCRMEPPRIAAQTVEWLQKRHPQLADAIRVLQASPVLAAIMACEPGSLPDVSYDDACQFRGRVKIVHEALARAEASERWRDLSTFRANLDYYWEVTEFLDIVEPVSSRLHMMIA